MNLTEAILDNFEHRDINKYGENHTFVSSYNISFSNDQAMYGQTSLKLTYDFSGWLSGNGAMFIIFKEDLSTDIMPLKFGVWVYGDGKSPWLRVSFVDGKGGQKTANLTEGNIDWQGWKYLEVPIQSNWELPIRLKQIYAVETNKVYQADSDYRGEIFIDTVRFVYVDDIDLIGPRFSDIFPEMDIVYSDSFTFYTTITDDMSGVDPTSIKLKINDNQVQHHFCERNSRISYQFNHVEQGSYHVSLAAKDYAGNKAIPSIEKIIVVDLSPDIEKPIISNITPTETALIHTSTPRITFNLRDTKSGIDEETIIVILDDRKLVVTYDEDTGWAYAISPVQLIDGKHHFSISAKDRSGNQLGPIRQYFFIEGLKQPIDQNTFDISIIPDTHSSQYAKNRFRNVANEKTDFIIHMGDLVDQATEEEYRHIKADLKLLKNKQILTVPGNHEAFQGNLELYMELFGSPTYHVEYGCALFIFLNTAYDQSIHASDSTQFDYLEELLNHNKKNSVIITTHVTTKDIFGTAHEMNRNDAERLEKILSNYKKHNKHIHITVLFGHLHVLQQWEIAGVQYIITGNGAAKGYVANEFGNILGHGILNVSNTGIKYKFIPDVTKITIKITETHMFKGTYQKASVQAEVDQLDSRYTVNLQDFDLVDQSWTSSNEKILKVDEFGIVRAMGFGKAMITVEISGKIAAIELSVTDNR